MKVNWKKAEILIVKLIENNISEEESEWLVQWLEDDGHLDYFNSFVEINYLIQSKSSFDLEASLKEVKRRIQPKTRRIFPAVLKYAASIIILLGSTYFLFFNNAIPNDVTPIVIANHIKIGTDKATLTLEDGSEVVLNKGTSYQTSYVESDGEALVYHNDNDQSHEIVYNVLTIPRGGQFFVQLSDGTKVWLNSESQMKYPKNFIEGEPRKVELVYGEAFFDVSHSTEHLDANFSVLSNGQNVEVLGTEFNIKAYQDEADSFTTLVDGEIALRTEYTSEILRPGQQAMVNAEQKIVTIQFVDTYNETSWKNGVFSFKGKTLNEITKVLSRWYDVEFEFINKTLKDAKFIGVLSKKQPLEEILETIKSTNFITDYEIKNNVILIE